MIVQSWAASRDGLRITPTNLPEDAPYTHTNLLWSVFRRLHGQNRPDVGRGGRPSVRRQGTARYVRPLTLLTIVLVSWGLTTHGRYSATGDEPHYLMIAQSLRADGDLDLANNYAQHDGVLFGAAGLEPETHARPGRGGISAPGARHRSGGRAVAGICASRPSLSSCRRSVCFRDSG